ncbi:preprotein translocase subunit SecA [Bradyrhizobium sp. GCM10027634]|uniref:preprotein translocase subunit SecA n=1 Tax=unclassified Bradyrhizobium TaxID=2631580 RepID=UPI00263B6BBF|nr:preprotein translocase subunit SecA [Bradyrhizobium sp. WYCCWR 12677]MDN5005291.1 preprotein translocase subunit SecA [Bradyrhizobium sp. WYCCWR 12677]
MDIDFRDLAIGRPYPERAEREASLHDQIAEYLSNNLVMPVLANLRDPVRGLRSIIFETARHESRLRTASDDEVRVEARGLRAELRRNGFRVDLVGRAFALVREAATRTLGQRHYDVQLLAGWGLLQGKLVEMATGEGKTIAATLPAATVALAGYPVHLITVNDYLAERDATEMGHLYEFLGLSVGAVVQGMAKAARREAYAKSITYCTNKELAFDYLRDRVALTRRGSRIHLALERLGGRLHRDDDLVLRGLYFGIVDEADSIFIDEARTPLILSASTGVAEERTQCEQALQFAGRLTAGEHYEIDYAERNVTLTAAGRHELGEMSEGLNSLWTSVRTREELVTQAITAATLFKRDLHYVVMDNKVQIVDESTGRVMADRSWERGLHQLIEVKENCELTDRRETLARITYQRLFRRYIRLAGMTGTAREVAREIKSVYGLDVVRIPLNRPSRRYVGSPLICATLADKFRIIADRVERLAADGRPVLIGTRSVEASEEISAVLNARGIAHALLNAKQDRDEANVVAKAGEPSQVTVATNMAGRGTDIRLGSGVAAQGGLHVILSEYHDSRRVDRQLFGRCARQGDPGSCEAIVSLEDDIFAVHAASMTRLIWQLIGRGIRVPLQVHQALRWFAQLQAERRHGYVRVQNVKLDRRLDRVLAFSGRGE